MEEELTYKLGYEKHGYEGRNSGNNRNGKYKKTIKSKDGEITIEVPRDRNGEYSPEIIRKGQSRFR